MHQSKVLRATFFLNAVGVESGGFPSIQATVDAVQKKSDCSVTYFEPWIKPYHFQLNDKEMDTLLLLMNKLERKDVTHKVLVVDQPTSIITVHTSSGDFEINDYGMAGEYPLNDIYRIVYRLDKTFVH